MHLHRSLPSSHSAALGWPARAGFALAALGLLSLPAAAQAQAASPSPSPSIYEKRVEVTATRLPAPADEVPAALTVVTGDELRDWGATNLQSALALVSGVDIAPGGDGGPASSVPEFWGLKEFDAFLLVVDGVPWGGAFNPALSTLDLHDVDRIEVMRGPAPVMYGATSFVGVIQVVHNDPGSSARVVSFSGGNQESFQGNASASFKLGSGITSSLSVDGRREGYRDDRTAYRRGHFLSRNSGAIGGGDLRLDVDGNWLDQDPASPHPRQGPALSDDVPLDANHNPDEAFLDDRRFFVAAGYDHPAGPATWATTFSVARASQNAFRGFLADVAETDPNARGFREEIDTTDIYLDSHLGWSGSKTLSGVAGFDYLHGSAEAEGGDFDYAVHLDGSGAPDSASLPSQSSVAIEDDRNFIGLYGQVEWTPTPPLRIELGARLNHTREAREEEGGEIGEPETDGEEARSDERTETRLGGSVGAVWTPWRRESNNLRVFASYRNTFKPAVAEFNIAEPEGEGEGEELILEPETADSIELGVQSTQCDGKLYFEANTFFQNFQNLVVPQSIDGLPALVNAGEERLQGIETSVTAWLPRHFNLRGSYAFHDAHFEDFLTEFDGVPTQLSGKRLEMSPRHLAAVGVGIFPEQGFIGQFRLNYVGERYLNKRNTALASDYATFAAAVGYRGSKWEVRLDGYNLSDERPAVAESEVGDAQYYRLPARRFDASATFHF